MSQWEELQHSGRIHASAPVPCAGSQQVGFVGIERAGSSFVRWALRKCAGPCLIDHNCTARLSSTGLPATITSHGARMGYLHASASMQRQCVGSRRWSEAVTFSLVRNPWARAVSAFLFHLNFRVMQTLSSDRCSSLAVADPVLCNASTEATGMGMGRQRWKDYLATHGPLLFRDHVRRSAYAFPVASPSEFAFMSSGYGNEQVPSFNASQLTWLVGEEGEMLVDTVYRLEDIEAAWQRIPCLQQLPYTQTVNEYKASFPDDPLQNVDYSVYYDDETRETVARYHAAEISRFGYTFDSLRKERPSAR